MRCFPAPACENLVRMMMVMVTMTAAALSMIMAMLLMTAAAFPMAMLVTMPSMAATAFPMAMMTVLMFIPVLQQFFYLCLTLQRTADRILTKFFPGC